DCMVCEPEADFMIVTFCRVFNYAVHGPSGIVNAWENSGDFMGHFGPFPPGVRHGIVVSQAALELGKGVFLDPSVVGVLARRSALVQNGFRGLKNDPPMGNREIAWAKRVVIHVGNVLVTRHVSGNGGLGLGIGGL